MAGNLGWYDQEMVVTVQSDAEINPTIGLYEAEWAEFDGGLMRAMDRPWRDLVFESSAVGASGMAPPDVIPL
jgi:hypothetical protein